LDVTWTSDASIDAYISAYTVSNWRAEGISPALIGVNTLGNIGNRWIEELAPNTIQVHMSSFTLFTDSTHKNAPIQLGSNSPNNLGLTIKNFAVGITQVTFAADNWDSYSLGRPNMMELMRVNGLLFEPS
jgi:hypothetical protein